MKSIFFKASTELEIVTKFDEATDCITESHNEVFKAGERIPDVEIMEGDTPDYVDIHFGDGSATFGVQRECFKAFEEGDDVTANPDDGNTFCGVVIGFKENFIQVQDQEDNVFDCEAREVEEEE